MSTIPPLVFAAIGMAALFAAVVGASFGERSIYDTLRERNPAWRTTMGEA